MNSRTGPVLACRGLRKTYRGGPLDVPVLMGIDLAFRRPRHGHSGCFFLTEAQMRRWTAQSYFMDRSSAFIGPLEKPLYVRSTMKALRPAGSRCFFFSASVQPTTRK